MAPEWHVSNTHPRWRCDRMNSNRRKCGNRSSFAVCVVAPANNCCNLCTRVCCSSSSNTSSSRSTVRGKWWRCTTSSSINCCLAACWNDTCQSTVSNHMSIHLLRQVWVAAVHSRQCAPHQHRADCVVPLVCGWSNHPPDPTTRTMLGHQRMQYQFGTFHVYLCALLVRVIGIAWRKSLRSTSCRSDQRKFIE